LLFFERIANERLAAKVTRQVILALLAAHPEGILVHVAIFYAHALSMKPNLASLTKNHEVVLRRREEGIE
jgi:hypothetical protein